MRPGFRNDFNANKYPFETLTYKRSYLGKYSLICFPKLAICLMLFNDFHNPQVAALPKHLQQYIVPQHYDRYTAIDHAVWRYVMRQNYSYLKKVAYYPYIKGLERAGLSIEHIPDLQTMNDNLAQIGWGAVAVDGFIPPAIFMEFQEYKVLVIAAEIRQLQHIAYTPTPDIIHESAGHAPIIADPDYNNYLSYFGAIGAKALFSAKDYELYDAIRALSILKEQPIPDDEAVFKAEAILETCFNNLGEPSEMALLSRLHWWSVEYGLIGSLEDPKIYGAGLLSSIGESVSCMQPAVKKYWYNLDTANQAYDITKAQPQLFVTPNFQNLIDVLESFADTMALRRGGLESIQKAIASHNIATAVFSSGLQVSGVFTAAQPGPATDEGFTGKEIPLCPTLSQPSFIQVTGPCALSYDGHQLSGHGQLEHADGFSSPVGKLMAIATPLEELDNVSLSKLGIFAGNKTRLSFESGIEVSGKVKSITRMGGKNLCIHFTDCLVKNASTGAIYFKPEWGPYDMAIGEKIISVFNGHADKNNYPLDVAPPNDAPKHVYDQKSVAKQRIYQQIRTVRNHSKDFEALPELWLQLKNHHPEDWLGPLEILELMIHHQTHPEIVTDIRQYLTNKANNEPDLQKLIKDGLHLIDTPGISLYLHQQTPSVH